jgi:hypothetical protein
MIYVYDHRIDKEIAVKVGKMLIFVTLIKNGRLINACPEIRSLIVKTIFTNATISIW